MEIFRCRASGSALAQKNSKRCPKRRPLGLESRKRNNEKVGLMPLDKPSFRKLRQKKANIPIEYTSYNAVEEGRVIQLKPFILKSFIGK
ncbi:hypothetical protein ACFS7Z_16000 [Pontibacter toksunensis]|uniref:Uncharacterized protein n=1 Tax=Pontibacter toksunensis TaxID=1332631 RepID=A0ABW6BXW9_9BACT